MNKIKNKKKKLTKNKKNFLISIIAPVYNESETIKIFIGKIKKVLKKENLKVEIIFINDGSKDDTLKILLSEQKIHNEIRIIDLSRNFGKEAALTAGLDACIGDAIIPIDVDLQDPPETIPLMIEKWKNGFEVVLGKRINRNTDTWAKRVSANLFYSLHNKISDPEIPSNVGDFRLMDRKVVDALKKLPESKRFMKGLFAWIGFKTSFIEYNRMKRIAGKTKFNGWRLWNFALEGITSFTTAPLRLWTYLGILVAAISFIFAVQIIWRVFIYGVDVPGYASIIVAVTFLSGLQLIGIGVIGEYLGRTYIETKRRPTYIVRQIYEKK